MTRQAISKEQQEFILKNYATMKGKDIAIFINVAPSCVSQYITGKRGNIHHKIKK